MSDKTKQVPDADDSNDEESTTPDESVATAKVDAPEASVEAVEASDEATEDESEPETEESAPAAAKAPRPKARNVHIRTPVKDGPGQYAVIETGGKQYRVMVGDRLTVEKITEDAGSDISFERVLLIGGDGSTRIGTPVVEGAAVTATVNNHGRGEKIVVFKYKAKKRYRRRTGHRQSQTYITITGITG